MAPGESRPATAPVAFKAAEAVVKVLVSLNPRGICEADALRLGAQLWLVTEWRQVRSAAGIWRPVRMIRIDDLKWSPMGGHLVLLEPMATRLFKGQGPTRSAHEIRRDPQILVDFGASFPAAGLSRKWGRGPSRAPRRDAR